jgi:LuxR family maltose regulon positive regulatory protein
MSAKTPRVWTSYVEDPQAPRTSIALDTPAWVAWLEAPTTRRFTFPVFDARVGYIVSFMTVRKERRQRGDWYWSVYHRQDGRIQRVYLGRSDRVTRARLEDIAQTLRPKAEPPDRYA